MGARPVLACAGALLIAAAPAVAASDVNPRVTPKPGHRGTTFRVAFTAPKAAGRQGVVERSYSVELSVSGRGCSQSSARTVSQAAAGERVKVRFPAPSERWCLGKGRGTISMTEGPNCDRSTGDRPCPEFPTSTRDIAHFTFKVVRKA
jgi:hypothetical protein